MEREKRRVALADIQPSSGNPREDMGDINALAEAIRVTGGEPVNPPVVVQDGGTFRIVDGERRYRAMLQLHEPADEVDVIVCDGYDEALELVSAMASDSRKGLTADERERGFQMAFLLGVPTETVSSLSGMDAEQVGAAKRVWQKGRMDGNATVDTATLEALALAEEFTDEKARDRVLKSKSPSVQAHKERDRIKRAELLEQVQAVCEREGVPWCDREAEVPGDMRVAQALYLKSGDLVGNLTDAIAEALASGAVCVAPPVEKWRGDIAVWTDAPEPEDVAAKRRQEAVELTEAFHECAMDLVQRIAAYEADSQDPIAKIDQLDEAVRRSHPRANAIDEVTGKLKDLGIELPTVLGEVPVTRLEMWQAATWWVQKWRMTVRPGMGAEEMGRFAVVTEVAGNRELSDRLTAFAESTEE